MYNVDYAAMLKESTRPYYTLAQAFAARTGAGIDTRMVQKLLKDYAPEDILSAIDAMSNRKVSNPIPYLIGILKKRRQERLAEEIQSVKFDDVIESYKLLQSNDGLVIRNPFDGITEQL